MSSSSSCSRRLVLGGAIAGAGLVGVSGDAHAQSEEFRIVKGRIKQSVMGWCFKPMSAEELMGHCKAIGLKGVEGIPAKFYPLAEELGLEISIVGSHGFREGFCNTDQHEKCVSVLRDKIDLAATKGYRSVITFTGMRPQGLSDEAGTRNCVEGLKKIAGYAEQKGVTLCLEHLNSRDDSHPMKGHPGYFGDDVDHCVDILKKVASPRVKLLFDVYHVQIMNGDVIRRIGEYKDYIGHYHTAGNPGRRELDENQEINYPAVMRAILETGYDGFVAQEFIPTWEDKVAALRHAAQVCDV